MSDARFNRLRTDPRFRRPKKNANKVVVDDRFKAIFDEDKSAGKKARSKAGRVDKYGRHIAASKEKDDLKRFYRLEGQTETAGPPKIIDYARGEVLLESSDEDDGEEGEASGKDEDGEESDDGEVVLGHHPSRPIPVLPEGEDEELEIDLDEDDDEAYADLDAEAADYANDHTADDDEQAGGDAIKTHRLAVVNLDWDHVRASHLFRIFSSLVSPTAARYKPVESKETDKDTQKSASTRVVRGKLLSVRIYPSEFGKERLKKEETEGPPKEIFKKSRRDDVLPSLLVEDEGDEYDEKALRKYHLERLRYYYAVATFDSVEAASHVLAELEGTELERSANVFDLSFVPDEMKFEDEFRDEATPANVSANTEYKPLDFSTEALRHSKVSLKWDEDDPERNQVTRRALTLKEIEEGDFKAFIASSGSESSDEEGQSGRKKQKPGAENLRKLLLGSNDDNLPEGWEGDAFGSGDEKADGDMEITFMPGLSENNKNPEEETTLEKYKRKQKEKRQKRKQEQKEKEKDEEGVKGNKKSKDVDDDFFGDDSGSDDAEQDHSGPVKTKRKAHETAVNDAQDEARPATEAELELLIAPDDGGTAEKHFDMKSIMKTEKLKGKKARLAKKLKKGINTDEVQEDFQIDLKDDRFKALHEDHSFAIDPSNPHFKKTKAMAALLDERTKRQPTQIQTEISNQIENSGERSLKSLVESVKRKSTQQNGKGLGKRRKV